jgi:antitoxin YqcF
MKHTPTESNKEWANLMRSKTGGEISIKSYYDQSETTSIDIFSSLTSGGKVCATIGLMDTGHEPPIEIIMDSTFEDILLENIISTAAFYVMKDKWKIRFGTTFETLVAEYHPNLHVKHLLFIPQYQWGPELSKVKLKMGNIYPVLAIGITDSELQFIKTNSLEQLENIWERDNIDVLNWQRDQSI